ncbi:MAG: bifunctional riboflavin kinase/FAD synthetase [Actinomycetota bacterium]|nr:bifunctional riboflavin kinase/FAD synthetase [Actinomycetota bacterium]
MKVFRGTAGLAEEGRPPTAVTIGNFYAVHRGHQALIRRVRARASHLGAVSTVVTFEPHPQKVLRNEAPAALVTPERKLQLLSEAGIDQVVILEFTPKLSRVEPEEFIERILLQEINAKAIVVGADFRFGRFARGDVTMLRSFGRRLGFSFEAVRMSEVGGRRISSTAIRHALAEGDVRWAAKALGRPYLLEGTVVPGSGRGAELGYPTANLEVEPAMCVPGSGIYAGVALHEGGRNDAAISIGTNPTFGVNPLSVEAHLLEFSGDLYGRRICIEFVARIRDHVAFPGSEALSDAIAADVKEVRRLLRSSRG